MNSFQRRKTLTALALTSVVVLAGCDENGQFMLGQSGASGETSVAEAGAGGTTVERDVEAPEVFQVSEAGLWDGRPSLGGVWVAHPDVSEPERVIIRNTSNGQFVVGALFRRERDIPGPRLQISSDAAEALGMLAGAPQELNVTALRREVVEEPAPLEPVDADTVAAPAEIEEQTLDPVAAASAAIDAAEATPAETATDLAATTPAQPAPQPAPPTSRLEKPFIQVGIFSIEANADRTAKQMRSAGMVPTIRRGETGGKPFWRVIVGPAQSSAERRTLLDKIKGEGFTDAYAVTN